jgi:hypothetical protein
MELEADKEDPRRAILQRNRRGEITRGQADAEARALGIDSMECHPDPDQFDPLIAPLWTLPMTVAWIVYRSRDQVRELMEDYRSRRLVWRYERRFTSDGREEEVLDLLSPKRSTIYDMVKAWENAASPLAKAGRLACGELWEALKARSPGAQGVKSGERAHAAIPDASWETLTWIRPETSIPDDAVAYPGDTTAAYREVRVRSNEVIARWPALHASDDVLASAAPVAEHAIDAKESVETQESFSPHPNDETSHTTPTIETTKPVEMSTEPEPTDRETRATRTNLSRLQARVLEIVNTLWPEANLPARVSDRDN